MTSTNNLEIKGNLREHASAELLAEIARIKVNGSLRVSDATQKTVVYFDAGDVVFAVSNARAFRLFELILRENKITKKELLAIPDFTNDLALSAALVKDNLFSKDDINRLFVCQIEEILRSVFTWREGEWTFSPLVRVKADIRFRIAASKLLVEYARSLSDTEIFQKFENVRESFTAKPALPVYSDLSPQEAFVFSRFEDAALNVEETNMMSGLPAAQSLKAIYALWLGGFLKRGDWNGAFSERKISEILSANLTLKKDEKPLPIKPVESKPELPEAKNTVEEKEVQQPDEEVKETVKEITIDEFLEQVEKSTNFYESLDISPEAEISEIKKSYFARAKRFHPDLFHKITDKNLQQRIQNAFTQVAQAYETLKTESSRNVYDFRMRKELAENRRHGATINKGGDNSEKKAELAIENFEQGFSLLMEKEYETALPFLARAVHFAENNARYNAYYGKALSFDYEQRHKAENALQTAVRLDPTNADWRFMLAEFFIEVRLNKRAEGELNRLLAIFPNNKEAKTLLDSLREK